MKSWYLQHLRKCSYNYRKIPKYSDTQKICSNHSKIWIMWLYHRVMSPNDADGMANSVDPDQTFSRSSLIWVCTVCPGISVRKLKILTVNRNLTNQPLKLRECLLCPISTYDIEMACFLLFFFSEIYCNSKSQTRDLACDVFNKWKALRNLFLNSVMCYLWLKGDNPIGNFFLMKLVVESLFIMWNYCVS